MPPFRSPLAQIGGPSTPTGDTDMGLGGRSPMRPERQRVAQLYQEIATLEQRISDLTTPGRRLDADEAFTLRTLNETLDSLRPRYREAVRVYTASDPDAPPLNAIPIRNPQTGAVISWLDPTDGSNLPAQAGARGRTTNQAQPLLNLQGQPIVWGAGASVPDPDNPGQTIRIPPSTLLVDPDDPNKTIWSGPDPNTQTRAQQDQRDLESREREGALNRGQQDENNATTLTAAQIRAAALVAAAQAALAAAEVRGFTALSQTNAFRERTGASVIIEQMKTLRQQQKDANDNLRSALGNMTDIDIEKFQGVIEGMKLDGKAKEEVLKIYGAELRDRATADWKDYEGQVTQRKQEIESTEKMVAQYAGLYKEALGKLVVTPTAWWEALQKGLEAVKHGRPFPAKLLDGLQGPQALIPDPRMFADFTAMMMGTDPRKPYGDRVTMPRTPRPMPQIDETYNMRMAMGLGDMTDDTYNMNLATYGASGGVMPPPASPFGSDRRAGQPPRPPAIGEEDFGIDPFAEDDSWLLDMGQGQGGMEMPDPYGQPSYEDPGMMDYGEEASGFRSNYGEYSDDDLTAVFEPVLRQTPPDLLQPVIGMISAVAEGYEPRAVVNQLAPEGYRYDLDEDPIYGDLFRDNGDQDWWEG